MVNTATAQTALPIHTKSVGLDIVPHVVTIDTVDTDLTIVTPTGTAMACVVGIMFSEGTAGTLTFKSGTTTLMALELAANQGLFLPLGDQIYFATQPGEALKIRSTVAITNMLIYVASTSKVVF
jgi:hypothetical protein